MLALKCWARDPEHAIKIANDRRLALIASGEWTTDFQQWLNLLYRKASQAGAAAFVAGQPIESNPHGEMTRMALEWKSGYEMAQRKTVNQI